MNEKQWCAHTEQLCTGAPEFEDEVTGEWWCRSHAGPLAWSWHEVWANEVVTAKRLELRGAA